MAVDSEGRLEWAARRDSPFFNERPEGMPVDLVVVHFISLPPGVFSGGDVERLFTGTLDTGAHPFYAGLEGLEVSSHFFIRRDGSVLQFVPVGKRAWHAGRSVFHGRSGCNDFSVGIELEGDEKTPFTDAQYDSLSRVVAELRKVLPIRFVTGHEFIAPGRKIDPGPFFDWKRLETLLGPDLTVETTPQA